MESIEKRELHEVEKGGEGRVNQVAATCSLEQSYFRGIGGEARRACYRGKTHAALGGWWHYKRMTVAGGVWDGIAHNKKLVQHEAMSCVDSTYKAVITMGINEQVWISLADAFSSAPFTGDWSTPLSDLANVTGSMAGQMIGFGLADSLAFNLVTEFGDNYLEDFVAMGGNDVNINPFLRAATTAPVLKVLSSVDFMTRKERLCNPFLVEHTRRYGAADLTLVKLIEEPDTVVGLSVIQSTSQGPLDATRKEMFSSLVPHVRAAVRTQIALENQGAAILAGALETLSLTAFICDRRGVVKAMTPSAEAMLGKESLLKIKHGLLTSVFPTDARSLIDAISNAAGGLVAGRLPVSSTLIVHEQSTLPSVLQILALPRANFGFGFDPRVLVVVNGAQPKHQVIGDVLTAGYELTLAEVDVVLRLIEGQAPEQVARERKAAVGTVRAQIRSIYEKLGVNHFYEFAARINQLR